MTAVRVYLVALAAALAVAGVSAGRTPLSTSRGASVSAHPGPPGPEATFRFPPKDSALQARLTRLLRQPRYARLARTGRISVALADLGGGAPPRYAGVHDDRMRYAASLPKIAVMLAVFDRLEAGVIDDTPDLRRKLRRMIRYSDNAAASDLVRIVGFPAIARTLRKSQYRLYDRELGGGLWVGKGYGGGVGRWRRDPAHGISHGATARQAARFLVMMERGQLVSPEASREMKRLMSRPGIRHKFVAGLRNSRPRSRIYRKSGTWRSWHADAALVEREGVRYVAVGLVRDPRGDRLLSELISDLDALVAAPDAPRTGSGRGGS